MKKSKMKIIIQIIICIIVFIYSVIFFVNNIIESKNITEPYTVKLEPGNCTITKENYSTKIEKYNGNAETLIIDSYTFDSEVIEIDKDSFLECTNLDTILIEKSIIDEDTEIEEFELDNTYINDKYVKYVTTKTYSEAYKQYMALSEDEKNKVEAIPNKYSVSINALYTESMEENYKVSEIASEQMAKNFDLRDYINLKVENQQNTGICYAFASLNSVETNLALVDDVNVDLSEVHAASLITGYGGNFIADKNSYYSDKIGPVYEDDWPIANLFATNKDSTTKAIYNYLRGSTGSLSSSIQAKLKETKATKYVTETVSFPGISKNSSAYNAEQAEIVRKIIKKHIMKYGSLYASISSSAITSNNGYYLLNTPSSSYTTNHAVSIIGWDDNFSKENFPASYRPKNNGAYLALNSWGEDWGNSGYFWISYEDYWAECEMSGVISVDGNISLTSMLITNVETNKEIPTEIITKGINANIEINTIVAATGEEQFGINIISPRGEDITNLISILENKIENNNGKIKLNIDTSTLDEGKYTINMIYGDEIFELTIEIAEGAIKGEGWYYVPEEAKLYILENHEEKTYEYLKKYINKVELEENIENILEYQFWDYSNLEEIKLPTNLTSIGTAAFFGCEALKDITIPEGVTSIEKETFYQCTNLKTVTMLAEVVNVGDRAFFECSSLEKIEISKGLANIGNKAFGETIISEIKIAEGNIMDYAFYGCTSLKEVDILEGVTSIGYGAFARGGIENVTIRGGNIGECAFFENNSLQNLNIKSNATSIGIASFGNCPNLTNINIEEGVTSIGKNAFQNCTALKSINIPKTILIIGYGAFSRCSNLTNVCIEEGVTSIDRYAFQECTVLKNINLPKSLSNIGYGAFYRCKNLANLEIPKTVTTVGDYAFNQSTTYIEIESGTISREELPNIIKRPTTTGDILNCNGKFTITNAAFNADYSELTINDNAESVTMTISNGKLNGLTIIADVKYRTITYSEEDWTTNDVIATFNIEEGDIITNNNGQNTYTFTENGEFEFQYTNAKGIQKTEIAKVENIDKDSPEVIITGIPTEYTDENVTLVIEAKDNLSGLAELPYSFDGGTTWQEENTKTYEENTNGIIIQVRDKLGNTYTHEEINITKIRRVQEIEVTTLPTKTEYMAHENFDEQGMIIQLMYDNNTSEPTTNYTIVNGNDLTCQVSKIIIQYNENTEMKTEIDIKVAHDIISAKCTEEGKCKIRGCAYTEDAKGHNYEIKVTEATCTEKGYTTHTCTRCQDKYVDEEKEALGHSFTNYESNNDATCEENGTETAQCNRCEETHTRAEEGSALGHNYEIKVTEATCTEKGYTTHTCTRCQDKYVDEEKEALGHSFTNYESNNDATCEENGTETAQCDRCEETHTRTEEGSALGHNYEIKVTEATCTEKGYTTHTCTRCQDKYVDEEKEALGHSFTNYETNNDATCEENGTETAQCDRCEETHTRTEEGSAKGHSFENGKCTECGKEEITITSEKYNISEEYITKIPNKKTMKELEKAISTNAQEIKILDRNNQELTEEDIIGTGMTLILKSGIKTRKFKLVILGDTTGDGKADFKDILLINKHRLFKITLKDEYLLAGDVTGDAKSDFQDILKINKFRLHKIEEL